MVVYPPLKISSWLLVIPLLLGFALHELLELHEFAALREVLIALLLPQSLPLRAVQISQARLLSVLREREFPPLHREIELERAWLCEVRRWLHC